MIIRNKLEVQDGGIIKLPGCEPISAQTSDTLAANIKCTTSHISLEDAINAIPGSSIELLPNSGGIKKILFVLPQGPPPEPGCNTCQSIDDYYQILKDAARSGAQTCKTITEVEGDEFCRTSTGLGSVVDQAQKCSEFVPPKLHSGNVCSNIPLINDRCSPDYEEPGC